MKSKTPLYAALVLGIIAGAVALTMALTGGKDAKTTAKGAAGQDAALRYPKTWAKMDPAALAKTTSGRKPVAAIERRDHTGVVIVRAEAPRKTSYQQLVTDLNQQLKSRFSDYKPVSQKLIQTAAGKALYFSYIRKQKGTAQSITLMQVGKRNYSINTVVRGGAQSAAKEAGAIIRSFGPATR
jgi:hypothetical protein